MTFQKSKGSIWRKWDLHIHSPLSALNNQYPKLPDGSPDWEKFIYALEQVKDIDVIGITDYFTIDGYKKVMEYKNGGRLSNIALILPNIEFRLDCIISSRKDGNAPKRIDYHVILSDKVSFGDIEDFFLHELDVCVEGKPQFQDEKWKLKRSSLEQLGAKLKSDHVPFQQYSDFIVGCMNAVVNHSQITDKLFSRQSKFKDRYLLILPTQLPDLIPWDGQDHQTRKILIEKSDCLFSSNRRTRDWAIGKGDLTKEKFIDEFQTLKPCLHGSDAHSLDQICKPDEERFCWIKADPTFDGLRQVVFEPEDRLIIQKDSPEPRKNIYSISNMSISNSKGFLDEDIIDLNKDLVAIIGGKGSGKTAFVDLIANIFSEHKRSIKHGAEEDSNSFIQRIEKLKEESNDHFKKEIKTSITFANGDHFEKSIFDDQFISNSTIIYLPQGKIESICSDKNKLDIFIKNIIFESKHVKGYTSHQSFQKRISKIDEIKDELQMLNDIIWKLENKTSSQYEVNIILDKSKIEGKLKDNESKVNSTSALLSEAEKSNINNLEMKINELKSKEQKLVGVKTKLIKLIEESEYIKEINLKISELNKMIVDANLATYKVKTINYEEPLSALITLLEDINKNLPLITRDIEDKKNEISKWSGMEKDQALNYKERSLLQAELKEIDTKISELNENKRMLEENRIKRLSNLKEIILEFYYIKEDYADIIETFSMKKEEILEGIIFKPILIFDKKSFSDGTVMLDYRKVGNEEIQEIMGDTALKYLESEEDEFKTGLEKWIEIISRKSQELELKIKTGYDKHIYYQWMFNNYINIYTEIYFESKELDTLSIGQKGTVILKLYLSEGDLPIILDQPEDNLDNQFIVNKLVNAFRQAKKRRQVIITTHNANLVVNTDAEQIIVANYENEKIRYNTGSMERADIREDILALLEGGREAFKKREKKYGLD